MLNLIYFYHWMEFKKKTIVDVFENSVLKYPDNTFLMEKVGDVWTNTSYSQVKSLVYRLGAGLVSIGVQKGDNIALLSEGRNLWIVSELAMFYAGAVNVPLSVKLEESNDLLFRLQHGDAKYIIVSGSQLQKVKPIVAQLPLLKKIIVLDEQPTYSDNEIFVDDVMSMGDDYLKSVSLDDFLAVGRSIQNDDLATITYTSGTTSDPKGVCLSHRNYTANVEQCLSRVPIDDTWRTLIILPLDHCFAHVVGFYVMMMQGASCATVQVGKTPIETLKNIPLNIKEIKPHFILSVPALAKSFKKNIEQSISKKGKNVVRLFDWGQKVRQVYYGENSFDSKGMKFVLKPVVYLFDKMIFNKVKENFGGELKFFIGGGALLDKDLQKFYIGIGLPMFQGYGLSEATPVISTNTPECFRFGSSGKLVEPIEVKICDDKGNELPTGQQGEIVVKGENVMQGYWKNETASADTVRDGWLYTGDLGYIGDDGLLYVKGRFKSLLISSDGEKYSPEGIEEAIVQLCPSVDQIMLYNNQSPSTSALVVPNKQYLSSLGFDLKTDEGRRSALNHVWTEISEFKGKGKYSDMFPDRWVPSTIAVLSQPFSEQNHMINSTMKMVRGVIEKTYSDRLEFVYSAEGKRVDNDENMKAFD